jgi:hypothetical protein
MSFLHSFDTHCAREVAQKSLAQVIMGHCTTALGSIGRKLSSTPWAALVAGDVLSLDSDFHIYRRHGRKTIPLSRPDSL